MKIKIVKKYLTHCICLLLSGKNGTWLLADRENGNSEWRVLLLACRNHCFIVEHML